MVRGKPMGYRLQHPSTCSDCEACCCRLDAVLISETGVPDHLVVSDEWGVRKMKRLDDGWCSALDRNTMRCMIYAQRPQVCRDFDVGGHDCMSERDKCGMAFSSGR